MIDKICAYCVHAAWDDNNWYHICMIKSGSLAVDDRKEIQLLDKCSANRFKASDWNCAANK